MEKCDYCGKEGSELDKENKERALYNVDRIITRNNIVADDKVLLCRRCMIQATDNDILYYKIEKMDKWITIRLICIILMLLVMYFGNRFLL